jgi:putative membrane protein
MKFLARILIFSLLIFGIAHLSNGKLLVVESPAAAALGGVLLALAHAIVKPVIRLITLPLTIVTLGLFSLVLSVVLNVLFLYGALVLVPGLRSAGFLETVLAAFAVSVSAAAAGKVLRL